MSYCLSIAGSDIARFRPDFQVDLDYEERHGTYLRFSSKNVEDPKLSILIVSTQNFCDRIKPIMSEIVTEKYGGSIFIKLAESIEQILDAELISYSTIDYVVVIFDTTRKSNINKLKEEISMIESSYVAIRRLCLVNGSPETGIKGTDLEIAELAQQYSLLHANGQIMSNSCKRLCERILELATTTCGYRGGIPFIIPTGIDVFRQLLT